MLYSIKIDKYVDKLPHKDDFDRWMKKLPTPDYENIVEALNTKLDLCDIQTSSWIPGDDWNGVYKPISVACGHNKDMSGRFFGLILFDLLMRREDAVWGFDRYEKNGVPIQGMTYFILQNPPEI